MRCARLGNQWVNNCQKIQMNCHFCQLLGGVMVFNLASISMCANRTIAEMLS